MIKTTILASIILFSATMMVQEVSSEEDIPFPIQHGGTGQAIPDWIKPSSSGISMEKLMRKHF